MINQSPIAEEKSLDNLGSFRCITKKGNHFEYKVTRYGADSLCHEIRCLIDGSIVSSGFSVISIGQIFDPYMAIKMAETFR